jgi:hypothetical protein
MESAISRIWANDILTEACVAVCLIVNTVPALGPNSVLDSRELHITTDYADAYCGWNIG